MCILNTDEMQWSTELNDLTGQLSSYSGFGFSSLHTVWFYYYSQSIWISRLFQEKTGLFCFRREGLRDMLKQQFSYFLIEECIRKKDRSREHSGGSVKEGGGNGFVQPVQGFQKQAQPTTMPPSLAWVLPMLPREREMHACCSICMFFQREHFQTSVFALINYSCLLLEETTLAVGNNTQRHTL